MTEIRISPPRTAGAQKRQEIVRHSKQLEIFHKQKDGTVGGTWEQVDGSMSRAMNMKISEFVQLGTALEQRLGKVPGVKRLPCYGPDGKLRPESGCAKRRDWLNRKSAELTMRGTENNNG